MTSGEPDKPTDTVARPEGDAPAGAAGKPARPTRKERARQGLRGSMLRSVLGTITVLGLLFGLVAGLLLWSVGRPIAAPDWMRDRIEARIAEALPGMEIAFSDLVLIVDEGWAPRIRLRDVALREVGGPPMMTLGDLEAGVSGEALLRGRLEPGRVILSGARLTLRRMADGTFDLAFGDALPPVEQAPNPAALLEGLDRLLNQPRFAGLTVIDADNLGLRYEDARTGRAWQVDGGFGAGHKAGFDRVSIEPQHFNPPGIVAAMPLHIHVAIGVGEALVIDKVVGAIDGAIVAQRVQDAAIRRVGAGVELRSAGDRAAEHGPLRPLRPRPARHLDRIGPGIEHALDRGGEGALDREFGGHGGVGHAGSPVLSVAR